MFSPPAVQQRKSLKQVVPSVVISSASAFSVIAEESHRRMWRIRRSSLRLSMSSSTHGTKRNVHFVPTKAFRSTQMLARAENIWLARKRAEQEGFSGTRHK